MSNVTLDLKDLDKLINKITRVKDMLDFSKGLPRGLQVAFDDIGKKILEIIRKETPVGDETRPDFHQNSDFHTDQKHLRDAWQWKVTVKGIKIEGFVFVSPPGKLDNLIDLLEAGSPRHTISARPGSVLSFYVKSGAGWEKVYSRTVDHPGFKANKFTARAQDKSKVHIDKIVPLMQREINKILLGR